MASDFAATAVAPSEAIGTATAAIRAVSLHKNFRSGTSELRVLNGIDLIVQRGEMIAIIGPSGSGKSTLLHLLAALDTPTSGAIYFEEKALTALSEAEQAAYRNRLIGFVWQRHHLLPDFTAVENVAMPLLVNGTPPGAAERAARRWLDEVGLAQRAGHRAGELSGGEQQRVALARALVAGPQLLLADEPTGDLDEQNAEAVFALMQRLHLAHGLTSVMATHNLSLARRCSRVLELEHGTLALRGTPAGREAQATESPG